MRTRGIQMQHPVNRRRGLALAAATLWIGLAVPTPASTFRPVGFEAMVRDSRAILRVEVTDISTFERPAVGERSPNTPRESVAPAAPVVMRVDDTDQADPATPAPTADPQKPISLGVEGGAMIFTRIQLAVEDSIKGDAPTVFELTVPGGTHEGERVRVFGLPEFRKGSSYLLFLREGYLDAGDPVVGVNQGLFRIEQDPATGDEILVDHEDDYVIAIEQDRVVRRANATRAASERPAEAPLPTPDPGYEDQVQVSRSPQAMRYWDSTEPALSPQQFLDRVRATLARDAAEEEGR